MFLRVETALKSDFPDPEAELWLKRIAKTNLAIGEKIRWVRRLEVCWMELEAPRDKIVNSLQTVFKDPVLGWLFTGDLLPSAAGPTGTLQDLMQAAPMRPGVFYGIEKRKRLQAHDEKAQVTLDAIQTVLGRYHPGDKLVTGELLLIEGPKLTEKDLEWISRYLFTDEKFESWSYISEDELRRNSRFQAEQVAKYLGVSQARVQSKWLQFRKSNQTPEAGISWDHLNAELQKVYPRSNEQTMMREEEWMVFPKIEFASMDLNRNTQNETEFQLLKAQLEMNGHHCISQLQSVLSVLPKRTRLWVGTDQVYHPERVWTEFVHGLSRVAETTNTPVVQVKCFEDELESDHSFFWVSTLGVSELQGHSKKEEPGMVELLWIGPKDWGTSSNTIAVEKIKEAKGRCDQAHALSFILPCAGKKLSEVLQDHQDRFKQGIDIVVDGHVDWYSHMLSHAMPLSQIWGVTLEQRAWVEQQLKMRGIHYLHFGVASLTGNVRVICDGKVQFESNLERFFSTDRLLHEFDLLDEPSYLQEPMKSTAEGELKFSVEKLLIKRSPLVFRPRQNSWAGLMVLPELFDSSFSLENLEWMLRKCTAMGGQVRSAQVSMLNGLKAWTKMIRILCSEFGIHLNQMEIRSEPRIQSHWCAIQFVSTVVDIRMMRSEDIKNAQERVYWLDGSFDQPAFRWLAGLEGRYQAGLSSAMAIDPRGIKESLVAALVKRKLGAEITLRDQSYRGGFLVTLSENERFAVEEEWKVIGIRYDYLGKSTLSPYLVIREEDRPPQTISIEDAKSMLDHGDSSGVLL